MKTLLLSILFVMTCSLQAQNDTTWNYSIFTGSSIFSSSQYWYTNYHRRVSYTENLTAPMHIGIKIHPPKTPYFLEYSGGFAYQPKFNFPPPDWIMSNLHFSKSFHFISIGRNFKEKNNLYFGFTYISTPLDETFFGFDRQYGKTGLHFGYGRIFGNIEVELRSEMIIDFKRWIPLPHKNMALRIKTDVVSSNKKDTNELMTSKSGLIYGIGISLFRPPVDNKFVLSSKIVPSHFHELRYYNRFLKSSIDIRRKTWTHILPFTRVAPFGGHGTWNYFGLSKYFEIRNTYLRCNLSYFSGNDMVSKWIWSIENEYYFPLHEGVYSERGLSAAVAVSLFKRMELELRFDTYLTYFENMQKPVNPASLSLNLQYLFF